MPILTEKITAQVVTLKFSELAEAVEDFVKKKTGKEVTIIPGYPEYTAHIIGESTFTFNVKD